MGQGVWRTINGTKVFIRTGETPGEAIDRMKVEVAERAARKAAKLRFIIPEDAWYITSGAPPTSKHSREYAQEWADRLVERGLDPEEKIEEGKKRGVIPQSLEWNYDPDWGMQPDTVYEVWRTGTLEAKEAGTYFGPTSEEVSMYTFLHGEEKPRSYKIKLKNPKIYKDKNELMLDLFPGSWTPALEAWYRREHGIPDYEEVEPRPHAAMIERAYTKNQHIEMNRKLDIKIAKALKDIGVDALVLLEPELPCSREIMLIDPERNLLR